MSGLPPAACRSAGFDAIARSAGRRGGNQTVAATFPAGSFRVDTGRASTPGARRHRARGDAGRARDHRVGAASGVDLARRFHPDCGTPLCITSNGHAEFVHVQHGAFACGAFACGAFDVRPDRPVATAIWTAPAAPSHHSPPQPPKSPGYCSTAARIAPVFARLRVPRRVAAVLAILTRPQTTRPAQTGRGSGGAPIARGAARTGRRSVNGFADIGMRVTEIVGPSRPVAGALAASVAATRRSRGRSFLLSVRCPHAPRPSPCLPVILGRGTAPSGGGADRVFSSRWAAPRRRPPGRFRDAKSPAGFAGAQRPRRSDWRSQFEPTSTRR